jgi:hypothetical protein
VIDAAVVTASDKVAVMFIAVPALYEPSGVVEEKLVTVGGVVSTTIALFAPNDPAAAGDGSVNTASRFDEFLIVPPFRASELVAT